MIDKLKLKKPLFSQWASAQLKSLDPIFREWGRVHRDYIKAEPEEEVSFWHNERPQVGLLAVAAWRRRKTALEEYRCKKLEGRNGKRGGRGDLYIRLDKKNTFECEAKQVRVNLGKLDECRKKIARRLQEAARDARRLGDRSSYHLGLCFVIPWINRARIKELNERWNVLLRRLRPLRTNSPSDAVVEIDGRQARGEEDQQVYPGVILLVRERRRGGGQRGNSGLREKSARHFRK